MRIAATSQKLMIQSATIARDCCGENWRARYLKMILPVILRMGGMEQSILKTSLKKMSTMFFTACTSQCDYSLDSDLCSIFPNCLLISASSRPARLPLEEKQGKTISSQMPSSCSSQLLMQLRYFLFTGTPFLFFSSQSLRPSLYCLTFDRFSPGFSWQQLLLGTPSEYLLLSCRSSFMLAFLPASSSTDLNSRAWSIFAISRRAFLTTLLAYCLASLRSMSSARMTCTKPFSSKFTSEGCRLPSMSRRMQKATILSRSLLQTSSSTIFSYIELTITLASEVMASRGREDWYLRRRMVIRQGSLERQITTSLTKVQASPKPSSASSRFSSSHFIPFSPFSPLSLPKLLNGFSLGFSWWAWSTSPKWTVLLQQEKRALCIFFSKAIFCSLSVASRKYSSFSVLCSFPSSQN